MTAKGANPLTVVAIFAAVVVVSFLAWALSRMAALGDSDDR